MTNDWYMEEKIPIPVRYLQKGYEILTDKDTNPMGAIASTGQKHSLTWTSANKQYQYFSNVQNGYIDGAVIKISSMEEYRQITLSGLAEAGDLLYWDEEGDGIINHATVITEVNQTELFYAGNTATRFDKAASVGFENYLKESPKGAALYIVRMKDSVFVNCNTSE